MTDKPRKPEKNLVRIIYQPRAGRAKTLRRNIDANGTVTINDGTHNIPATSMGIWKGKLPWVRINQDQLTALPWTGEASVPSPQFFNEAINNHYARDALEGLEAIDRKEPKGTLTYILLGSLIAVVLAMSFWILKDVSSLHDALVLTLQATHNQPTMPPGVVDGSVQASAPHA